jgi:D-sedoheptulose 7-phosphate isomerase
MSEARDLVEERIAEAEAVARRMLEGELPTQIAAVAEALVAAYRQGNKAVFLGNGGSAADAEHLAGEFLGRYLRERRSLPAVALACNPSTVTAIANDYGYAEVFSRQLEGLARSGDVVVALSTSGRSENVLRAVDRARDLGVVAVGMTGADGGSLAERCDHCLCVPAEETPRIQEAHVLIGHTLCEFVERELFAA